MSFYCYSITLQAVQVICLLKMKSLLFCSTRALDMMLGKRHFKENSTASSPGRSCWLCSQDGCPPETPAGRRCNDPSNGHLWPDQAGAEGEGRDEHEKSILTQQFIRFWVRFQLPVFWEIGTIIYLSRINQNKLEFTSTKTMFFCTTIFCSVLFKMLTQLILGGISMQTI